MGPPTNFEPANIDRKDESLKLSTAEIIQHRKTSIEKSVTGEESKPVDSIPKLRLTPKPARFVNKKGKSKKQPFKGIHPNEFVQSDENLSNEPHTKSIEPKEMGEQLVEEFDEPSKAQIRPDEQIDPLNQALAIIDTKTDSASLTPEDTFPTVEKSIRTKSYKKTTHKNIEEEKSKNLPESLVETDTASMNMMTETNEEAGLLETVNVVTLPDVISLKTETTIPPVEQPKDVLKEPVMADSVELLSQTNKTQSAVIDVELKQCVSKTVTADVKKVINKTSIEMTTTPNSEEEPNKKNQINVEMSTVKQPTEKSELDLKPSWRKGKVPQPTVAELPEEPTPIPETSEVSLKKKPVEKKPESVSKKITVERDLTNEDTTSIDTKITSIEVTKKAAEIAELEVKPGWRKNITTKSTVEIKEDQTPVESPTAESLTIESQKKSP